MIRSLRLRVALLVRRYGPLLALALGVVGMLLIGSAGWLAATPPTTEVTDETHRQTVVTNVSTTAVASGNSSLYPEGRVLRDQAVYLPATTGPPRITPTVSVPGGGNVTVSQRLVLTYTASHDGEVFWNNSRTLARDATTTSSGRTDLQAPLNLTTITDRRQAVSREIGGAGTVDVDLRLEVEYSTGRYNGSMTVPIPLELTDQWVRIGTPTESRTHSTPVARTVTVPHRPAGMVGGLRYAGGGLLLAGLLTGAGTVALRRSPDTGPAEQLARVRYASWISEGQLPDDAGEVEVRIDSLPDLVDVAIDAGSRVIYDPDVERFVVLDGRTAYLYEPD